MANNIFSKWFDNWKESINKIKTGNGTYAGGITQWINNILGKNKGDSTENNGGTTTQNITPLNAPANVTPTTTTYSANVSPETVSTEGVTGNPTTAPTNTEGDSTETPTTPPATTPTPTEPTAETPMTYEEYIASEKERAEQERQQAHRDAELAKERATVDAHADYEQSKATYGANAETMAQMGLTGGGYSDYLNAQAYAQKRDDIQHANVVEAATKQGADTAYSDKISKLNAEQIARNEEQQAYKDNAYSALLAEAQNPNTTYTAESIREIAEKAGLSEEEIQGLVSTLTTTKDNAKAEADNAKNTDLYNSLWIEVQKPDTAYTVDSLTEFMRRNGMSEADITALTGILQSTLTKREEDNAKAEADNAKNISTNLRLTAIEQITTQGGLSTEYINQLKAAGINDSDLQEVIKYNQNYHFTAVKSALNAGDSTTKADLDLLLRENRISQEQYNELLTQNQGIYNDYYTEVLDASIGDFDFSAADKAYKDGNISKTQYDALKNKFNTDITYLISAATLFYKEDGSLMDESAAKAFAQKFKDTGWLSSDNSTKLDSLLSGTYKKEDDGDDGGGCFANGTMVTVADGSRVPIETLKEGDSVLVFNHITGKADVAKILFIYYENVKDFDILKLSFDCIEDTEVISAHGFFDVDLNKYVVITFNNVKDYIGHKFLCVDFANGETATKTATLTAYETYSKKTECFAVITTKHINSLANGLLTMPDNNDHEHPKMLGFNANLFEYGADYTYNKEEMESDIAKYGLIDYDEWCKLAPDNINLSGLFFGIGGEYLKIALAKGLMTLEDLQGYIEIGAKHNGNT